MTSRAAHVLQGGCSHFHSGRLALRKDRSGYMTIYRKENKDKIREQLVHKKQMLTSLLSSSEGNQIRADLEKELQIEEVDDWYNQTLSQMEETSSGKLLTRFFTMEELLAV
jgi:hypothetical protein